MNVMPHRREVTLTEPQLTREEAIEMFDSDKWKSMTDKELVELQLYQRKLCIPFDRFHEAITNVLDRPVYTHEFAWPEELQDEFEGKKPKSPPEEVFGYIDPSSVIRFEG
jgi:hypothetical protein